MLTIAKLFGKSPFAPLQTHMAKVALCVSKLGEVFHVFKNREFSKIDPLVSELCKLEHEADLTKNDIRNHLPKSLFLPIDRSHFLDILSIQDSISDKAEHIGLLMALKNLNPFEELENDLLHFFKKNEQVFLDSHKIICEFDELLESSFGGAEAEKVKTMIEKTALKEHEVDIMKQSLLKKLFSKGDTLSPTSFHLWLKLIEETQMIAALSEKLANRIRMVLEFK